MAIITETRVIPGMEDLYNRAATMKENIRAEITARIELEYEDSRKRLDAVIAQCTETVSKEVPDDLSTEESPVIAGV